MTPDTNWSNREIDHVKPTTSFDVSHDEELKETFNWKNTEAMFKKISSTNEPNFISWNKGYKSLTPINFLG